MAPKRETALELWGKELAAARKAAGMSGRQLAQAVNVSPGTIGNWEAGTRMPDVRDIRRVEKVLNTSGHLERMLVKWVSREVPSEWTDRWLSAEANANVVYGFEVWAIPGLLQTEEYARAMLEYNRRSPVDIDELVRRRLDRQAILDDGNPPTCVFVVDEYALRRNIGGPKVMAEQLKRLRELAEHPDIAVQIVPLGTQYYPVAPFMIVKLEVEVPHSKKTTTIELGSLDNALTGEVVEGTEQILEITRIWEDVRRAAASPKESIGLIEKAITEWEA